jgi:hypothetical protein
MDFSKPFWKVFCQSEYFPSSIRLQFELLELLLLLFLHKVCFLRANPSMCFLYVLLSFWFLNFCFLLSCIHLQHANHRNHSFCFFFHFIDLKAFLRTVLTFDCFFASILVCCWRLCCSLFVV